MIIDSYDPYLEERHPACKGGCGNLADECECRFLRTAARRAGLDRLAKIEDAAEAARNADDANFRPTCRWSRCTEEAESRGYCDVHFGTL